MTHNHSIKAHGFLSASLVSFALMLISFAPSTAVAQMDYSSQAPAFNLQAPSLLQQPDPFKGSVTTSAVTDAPIMLSLDDAIARGLEHNLGLIQQQQTERLFQAQVLTAENALMPDITMKASTGVDQVNLVTFDFKKALIAKIAPGVNINPIVQYDVTSAEADVKQTLFSMYYIDLYRASRSALKAENLDTLSDHGTVIYNVAGAYLQVLADTATVENARAELSTSQRLLQQTTDQDEAGTATHLDLLRAKVQQQNDEQVLVQAQGQLAKDYIALNRVIGLAPEQKVQLTDPVPYADLASQPLDEIRAIAYTNRKDYLALLAATRGYDLQARAVHYERAPTLSFNGNYGVTGITRGLYHGTMYAAGRIEFPLFKEAQLRGDRDVANAQMSEARAQLASLRGDVDAQLRSSLLDVAAAEKLVKVAESNRDLAQQALHDSEERYHAGVDDNLPLVRAQATVAAANAQWVSSLYQFNLAKLALAQNTGILESQYKKYLGQ